MRPAPIRTSWWTRSSASLVVVAAVVVACGGRSGRASASTLEDACVVAAQRYVKCGSWVPADALVRSCRSGARCAAQEMRSAAEAPYVGCEMHGPCGAECLKVAGEKLTEPPGLAELRGRCKAMPPCGEGSRVCNELVNDVGMRTLTDAHFASLLQCFGGSNCAKTFECLDARTEDAHTRMIKCITESAR